MQRVSAELGLKGQVIEERASGDAQEKRQTREDHLKNERLKV